MHFLSQQTLQYKDTLVACCYLKTKKLFTLHTIMLKPDPIHLKKIYKNNNLVLYEYFYTI